MSTKFIHIGEHNFELPALPTKQNDILFSKEKKANQYWRRQTDFPDYFFEFNPITKLFAAHTEYNQDNVLISLDDADSEELIRLRDRELIRRWEGVWFMNNGELTYLTPGHYFALQWGAMFDYQNPEDGSPYGQFRMFQRDYFYFREHCKKQKNVLGDMTVKSKKSGITQITALDYVDEATKWKEKRFGFMSKTHADCKDTNFALFLHAYDHMPYVLKPEVGKRLQDEIFFSKVRAKITSSKKSQIRQSMATEGFNTGVYAKATVVDAFDGPKYFRIWHDEFIKYEDPYFGDVFKSCSQAVKLGDLMINGKASYTCYVPEDDKRSFLEARKIYFDSKLRTISKETGRTASELLCYFIPADVATESTECQFDRYGNTDTGKLRRAILAARKQKEADAKDLQAHTRQYPIIEEEAWSEGGGAGSTFNNLRLGKKRQQVEETSRLGHRNYLEGNLKWTGPRMSSEIKFVPLTAEEIAAGVKAPFRILFPEYLSQYKFNQPFTTYDKIKFKPNNPWCVAGIDPTDYVQAKDITTASKNAAWIFNIPNIGINTYFGKCVTDRPIIRYYYRHNSPKDTYEDIVMMIMYFGCLVMIEANKPWLITKLKEEGLEEFIMVIDSDKKVVQYNPREHTKLSFTTKEVIDNYCRYIDTYLDEPPQGAPNHLVTDMLEWLEDIDTLIQLMAFDPLNTQKYDLAVAFGYARLGIEGFSAIQKRIADKGNIYNQTAMQSIFNKLIDSNF